MKIIIFHAHIARIGGVETFAYNMCKQLCKLYDVELFYKQAHDEQLERLSKFVKCVKYDKDTKYECDILILASSWGGYPESIVSTKNEYWQMIHANYKELAKINYTYSGWERTTRHICVSKSVAENFENIYKIKCDVIYNILDDIQKTKPILKLISATRLSNEKGYKRMVQFAKALKRQNIKFRWTIFTDLDLYSIDKMNYEEIVYMKPTYDIWDYIKEADYGVQLSDTEGYSYFINECMQYGTPLIATSFDSIFESVIDKKSGYILDFDLFKEENEAEFDKIVKKIATNIPKDFKYVQQTSVETWVKELGTPEKKEKYVYKPAIIKKEYMVLLDYFDIELQRKVCKGEIMSYNKERASILIKKGFAKVI